MQYHDIAVFDAPKTTLICYKLTIKMTVVLFHNVHRWYSTVSHYLIDTVHHILIAGWAWHEQKQSE